MENNEHIKPEKRRLHQWRSASARTLGRSWYYVEKYTNLRKPEAWLTVLSSLLLRIGAILLVVGLVLFLWRMLNYEGYNIQQFSVPKQLEENGFSGTVIARQLEDQYLHLKSIAVSIKEDSVQAVGDEQQPELNVDVLGVGLSLRSIGFHLRDLFGRENNFIRGEITQTEENLALTLRMSGTDPETMIEPLDQGRREAVRRLLERAAESILKNTDPYRLAIYYDHTGNYKQGIKVAQEMLMHRPSEEHWAYLAWGVNLESRGRHQEALGKYERAIDARPDFPLPWLRKGYTLRRLGRNEEAIEFLGKATDLKPEESSYWNAYGIALYFAKRYDEADLAFQKAEEFAGDNTAWLFNWADKKAGQGQIQEAIEIVDRAILKAEQNNKLVEEIDARLFKAVLQMDTVQMNNYADIKLAIDPGNIYNLNLISTAYFRAKSYRRMIRTGKMAIALDENAEQSQRILNLMAMSYNFIGQPDSGLYYIRQSIERDTATGYPYSTLAETYHYLGQQDAFYQTLELALQKGMSPQSLRKEDEPYNVYWEKPRFKELMARYDPNRLKD
ncbi:tetratricopeptide repeat protein [Flavilitoribacter nigricans]|uniref:Uncharacterized protein n=1 Tax=Flavilitoribacter nigricans (strain ATCC 23147 / DSM 23189 / NBRC 102662 / NCIMB 1420 / SS-2) TaxID=1122177 RepID=A0A2D0NHQ7_FLAN2|nr:tetratricopeptide repeat protein [Flavilitoribacter nigricans]PHN08044.1 hypothetical protein CRP01_03245 [Flavilitoribacter nigricans DSM 23189 = NBRC 102662]